MLGRTHLAVGVAASLAVLSPETPHGLAIALIGGALGGAAPDIDVIKNHSHLDNIISQSTAFVIAALSLFADYYYNLGIWRYLMAHTDLLLSGGLAYLLLLVIGFYAPHRGFTHSILGLVLYTGAISAIYPPILTGYALGYASHIALDLLNRKPVRLLFPVHKGICLGLCYSNRLANRCLFLAGVTISIGMMMRNFFLLL